MKIVFQAMKMRVAALAALAAFAFAGSAWGSEYIQTEDVAGEVHASTLLPLTNGAYLAAWFGGTKEGTSDVAIYGSRRVNKKWETPRVLAKVKENGEDKAHWNPVLRRADDGRISLYFKVGTNCEHWVTYLIESKDEGETWDAPRELVKGDVSGGRGPVRNKCLRLDFPSRRWLAPASCEIDGWRAFIDRSGDDGLTWTKSVIPMPEPEDKKKGVIQPTLWLSTNGIVRAYMRSNTGYIWETESTDSTGIKWNQARETKIPNKYSSGIDIVKASDGCLYLVLNTWPDGYVERNVLEIWRSTDDGANWSSWEVLEKENGCEFSYPCIIEPEPGKLAVTYTWKRKRIAFAEFSRDPTRVYVTISSAYNDRCLATQDWRDSGSPSPEPDAGTGVATNAVVKKGSTVGTKWGIPTKEGLHEGYAVYLVYGKSYAEVTNMVLGGAMSYSAFTKWATRLDEGDIKQLVYAYNINGDGKKALQLSSMADFNDASKPVAVFTYIQDDWLVPQYNVIDFDKYSTDSKGNSYPHYNGTRGSGTKCTGWLNFGSTYAVTLNGNGGNFKDVRGYYYSERKTLPTATKTGLTFDGWYADAAFTGSSVAAFGPNERGDKTFWAKWVMSTNTTDDAGVSVTVKVPEAWTTEKGVTDITASGANNIPYWKSYVLGLDPKDANSKTVVKPVQTSDKTQLTLNLGSLVPKTDAGVTVKYALETKDGTDEYSQYGEEQASHQFNFPLDNVSGVKYFRIQSRLYKQ